MSDSRWLRACLPIALLAALAFAGCGGGGSSGGESNDDLKDLVLIDVNVGGTDGVPLNQVIEFQFSEEVVASSVTPETMRIRLSPFNAQQVPGDYNISGNIVEFFPRLPTMPDLSDAGLVPGSTYEIKLVGHPKPNTLENADGDPLAKTYKVSFRTAAASSPDLFIDYNPDSQPHVLSVNPKPGAIGVPQAIEVEITFSEPLHPSTVTTGNISLTMVERPPGTALSPARPIPGQLILEQNRQSVVVRFDPDFPLADDARYILDIDRRVTDFVNNDLVPWVSDFTIRDEPPVPGEFTLDFGPGSEMYNDTDVTFASWNMDVEGALAGIFTAAAGNGSDGDFSPKQDTTLNSTLSQDTFAFRSFEIPAGVTLRLSGPLPIKIMSLATMKIEGTVIASGETGEGSESASYNSKIPAAAGGDGGPGGGDGGGRFTNVPSKSYLYSYSGNKGEDGDDGYGTNGTGGKAASWGTAYNYKYGTSGGGGGGHRTAGEAGQKGQYTGYAYYNGVGGAGGGTGGNADCDPLTGGGGGGCGMNCFYYSVPVHTGASTGGGGGGGVRFQCANDILVTNGHVIADGGDGGPVSGTYAYGGGSAGGGAGGAIHFRSIKDVRMVGSTLSVQGGDGAPAGYTYYKGAGGDGGDGWLNIEDSDGQPDMIAMTLNGVTGYGQGTFSASGPGAPSIGQTLWINMGVFQPTFLAVVAEDVTTVIPKNGQTVTVMVQAAPEDVFDLGFPDEDFKSAWVPFSQIDTLNGNDYSFIRYNFTFVLADDQEVDDPVPCVDAIRVRFTY